MTKKLGSIEASEKLIYDLYIDLRRKINKWAKVTHQTAQARMGYVGQHLVSIVTGYPGGKSGARGKDLIISENEFAEIKTCYRVDQLGKCNNCGAVVASIEKFCPTCGSSDIHRNNDSKWLIGIRHDEEFNAILEPKYYYLVLFDFTDLNNPETVRSSIWEVDPVVPGFSFCMIDYYVNIRAKSKSKAPFNLWPFQLKFDLMRGKLIYRSYIYKNDNIKTIIFPGRDEAIVHLPRKLGDYSRSKNLTIEKLRAFANKLGININWQTSKSKIISSIDAFIEEKGGFDEELVDILARNLYWPGIEKHISELPDGLLKKLLFHNLI